MGENIVVGVTSAPVAQRAVDWAVQRAADRAGAVELVAVVGGAVGIVGEAEVLVDALQDAQELLDAHAARAQDPDVTITTKVARGNPVTVLVDESQEAAVLVLGSDYRGPQSGPARGFHGMRLASAAHCPVVVIPDIDLGERRGVVVGVDGSQVSAAAIRFAAAEADRLGEPLIAVAVWTPLQAPRNRGGYPAEYLENLAAMTAETLSISLAGLAADFPQLEVRQRVERGYPSAVLTSLAAESRLLVVGSHGRGAVARFLLGSISQEVLARLATVTVVVR